MNLTAALAFAELAATLEQLEEESQDVDPDYTHEVGPYTYSLLLRAARRGYGRVVMVDDAPSFRGFPVVSL